MSASIYTIYESSRCIGINELPDIFEDYFDTEDNPVPEFESDEYWEFNELVNIDEAETFCNELHQSLLNQGAFLVTGRVGWYERHRKFHPVLAEGIEKAVNICAEELNADYCDVEYENGSVIIRTRHHDGENWFEVRRLSDKGIAEVNKALAGKRAMREQPDWFRPLKLNEIDF